jgi:alpha 1,2-mannosyltransferase
MTESGILNPQTLTVEPQVRILIGTPCYGGQLSWAYVESLILTREYLQKKNIVVDYKFIPSESLIPRGRNTISAQFLSSPKKYTHLLFIDADIRWEPIEVEKLISNDKDVVGGLYPKKGYRWERLKSIDLKKDDISTIRAKMVDYNINYLPNETRIVNSLIKVLHIATGFMMIKRSVFENLMLAYPHFKYKDDIGMLNDDENKYLYSFFDLEIVDGHYLSEDWAFCHRWNKLGGEVYANLSINLMHIGTHVFYGNYIAFLKDNIQIAAPTTNEQRKVLGKPSKARLIYDYKNYATTKNRPIDEVDILTNDTCKKNIDNFLENLTTYPKDRYNGRGIVICADGNRYYKSATFIIKYLREHLNCKLPIEWFYIDDELTNNQINILENTYQNVKCVNAVSDEMEKLYGPILNIKGYELKPFSVLASSFNEVLLIDADNIPIKNVEKLFDMQIFQTTGSAFWCDYWSDWVDEEFYKIMDIGFKQSSNDIESGQLMVNKSKCWKAINLAWYMNNHSYYTYQYFVGDKDIFRFAWEYSKTPIIVNMFTPQSIGYVENDIFYGNAMLHFDYYGERLFIHMTLCKIEKNDDRGWKSITSDVKKWRFIGKDGTNLVSPNTNVSTSEFSKELPDEIKNIDLLISQH